MVDESPIFQIVNLADSAQTKEFPLGRFEVVVVKGNTVGRATYAPGWKWSRDVAGDEDRALCQVEHLGVVLQGRVAVRMENGSEFQLRQGDVFYIPPGHDSWVVGNDSYSSLHVVGAGDYVSLNRPR